MGRYQQLTGEIERISSNVTVVAGNIHGWSRRNPQAQSLEAQIRDFITLFINHIRQLDRITKKSQGRKYGIGRYLKAEEQNDIVARRRETSDKIEEALKSLLRKCTEFNIIPVIDRHLIRSKSDVPAWMLRYIDNTKKEIHAQRENQSTVSAQPQPVTKTVKWTTDLTAPPLRPNKSENQLNTLGKAAEHQLRHYSSLPTIKSKPSKGILKNK